MYCSVLFKQKTAYDMRIRDWSSDVCSSDLVALMLAYYIVSRAHGRRSMTPTWKYWGASRGDPIARSKPNFSRSNASTTVPCCRSGRFGKIRRASCRERVCQEVYIQVVSASFKKKQH